MIHPEMANVPKSQIKAKLASIFKSKDENISIFGLKTKFGGGRTTGFALIYDSSDVRKKYDSKKNLRRVSSYPVFSYLILGRNP
jgi:small subunit ribosomal protein S24e